MISLGVGLGGFTPVMAAPDFDYCLDEYMGCEDPAYPSADCFDKFQLCMEKAS